MRPRAAVRRVVKASLRQRGLLRLKSMSLRASASSRADVLQGEANFGFIPREADVRVLGWPRL